MLQPLKNVFQFKLAKFKKKKKKMKKIEIIDT